MEGTQFGLTTAPLAEVAVGSLTVFLPEQSGLSHRSAEMNEVLGGGLLRLREQGDVTGKTGELAVLPLVSGIKAERVLIAGLGTPEKLRQAEFERAVLLAVRKAAGREQATLALDLQEPALQSLGAEKLVETAVCASIVGAVTPGCYKAQPERFALKEVRLIVGEATPALQAAMERGRILGEAVNLVRELVNRHPEDVYPATFAERATAEGRIWGLQCEVFDQARLEAEKMGSLLAVARGSAHEPRAVFLKYQGAGNGDPWLAFCGKGVTFDSGGLSLKPSPSMLTMKADMAGAATALAAMVAIARLKLKVNVLAGIGLVENMVGPHSYKLGEVLTARNGKTIEVHNTDAEGRLVLADILSYVAELQPAKMVDLATLTGSCMVALGEDVTGVFANCNDWCRQVLDAAKRAGEDVWPMPMFDSFDEQLKSDFADMKNVGGKWGGAITAAKFLQRFVNDVPWVHLDIAGPSFGEAGKPWRDVGGTGAMLKTLVELAQSFPSSTSAASPCMK